MLKMLIAGILGGFILGIFTVAVLGWINDVYEDKELARLDKLKNDERNKNNKRT